jgi:hypothetical protein
MVIGTFCSCAPFTRKALAVAVAHHAVAERELARVSISRRPSA